MVPQMSANQNNGYTPSTSLSDITPSRKRITTFITTFRVLITTFLPKGTPARSLAVKFSFLAKAIQDHADHVSTDGGTSLFEVRNAKR